MNKLDCAACHQFYTCTANSIHVYGFIYAVIQLMMNIWLYGYLYSCIVSYAVLILYNLVVSLLLLNMYFFVFHFFS